MKLTPEQKRSVDNYRRLGIDLEVLEKDKIKITQSRPINGYILNQKQLVARAREIFKEEIIIPVVFALNIHDITIKWIENKMDEYGIKRRDLVKQLALDKSYLSRLFGNSEHKITLSKPMKATFFYYFLTYELNRELRDQLNK